MADYSQYPTATDIEVLMKSVGAWPTNSTAQAFASEQASICAVGAAAEWERRTGWHPFLKGDDDEVRTFEQTTPRGVLDLGAGLLELTSITVGTETYTEGEQFRLLGLNNSLNQYPFTTVHFKCPINAFYTRPIWDRQITITGKWGFASVIPADAWMAMLRYAGVNVLSQLENQQNVASLSQDGFSKQFDVVGVITQQDLLNEWSKIFDRTVGLYRRVTV